MRKFQSTAAAAALVGAMASAAVAQNAKGVPVTVDNFVRAETDMYFGTVVNTLNGFGQFAHSRELTPVDAQAVVRPNRDTLYSNAVFDLDAGPVTVTMPDPGKRFMSLQPINEDEYVVGGVTYDEGAYTFGRTKAGTRYMLAAVRTLVDPDDPKDLEQVHALQDKIKVRQPGGPGKFETPNWDPDSQKKVRDALATLASTISGFKGAFGAENQVDPVHHLIGAAVGWGGNPDKDATYLGVTPSKNDGATVYRLKVKNVPVNGFWSISVYNAEGYFQPNPLNAYSVNNLTAKTGDDGSVAIQFGGCDGKIPNCLPIMSGWNYTVRLYRPREEILNGKWVFPQAQPVS